MKTFFKTAAFCAVSAIIGLASNAHAQLTITEILYNPTSDNDGEYSWFEVRNDGAVAIDLDGAQVEEDGAFYQSSFSRSIVASDQVGTTTTVIQPGEIAVLYDGWFGSTNANTHNAESFRSTFNVPETVPVISTNFFPNLANDGDTFGIWATDADVLLDATEQSPGSGTYDITSFNNTIATVTYDTAAPWPGDSNGIAIQWDGTNPQTDGGSWYSAGSGEPNFSTSNQLLSDQAGLINSTSDFASPGQVPFGTAASGLLITEIMNDPASTEDDWEWVEVYNNTGATIDFAATPYVIDDGNASDVTAANISSGSIADGTAAVLYNGEDLALADIQAAWGASINFIPVTEWGQFALNNGANSNATDAITDGYNDQVTIWDDFATYEADRLAGNVDNAVISVEFAEADVDADPGTTVDNWPENPGNSASLYLNNLSGDPNDGSNWGLSGDGLDFIGYAATGVPTEGNEEFYPGGDVGSPGYFTAFVPVADGLDGDFNDDGTVDAADYTVWRDNLGQDAAALNGNGTGDALVVAADYDLWAANYGSTSSTSTSAAVPEPTTALLLLLGVAGFVARRNG